MDLRLRAIDVCHMLALQVSFPHFSMMGKVLGAAARPPPISIVLAGGSDSIKIDLL